MRALLLVSLLVACGGDDPQGVDTGSTCPPTPLTYASFGQAFFASYCTSCHAETVTGDARQGAPRTIDFDTRSGVRMNTSRIDKTAAFGPDARNHLMPPADHPAQPTDEERRLLGEYIACEIGR